MHKQRSKLSERIIKSRHKAQPEQSYARSLGDSLLVTWRSRTMPWDGQITKKNRSLPLTRTGWTILLLTPLLLLAGIIWQWEELLVISVVFILCLLVGWLQTRGNNNLNVQVKLDKNRLKRGQDIRGKIIVFNPTRLPQRSITVELPFGANQMQFTVPALTVNKTWEQEFIFPARKRDLITIGPARSVKMDLFGLYRLEQDWNDKQEVYVHPNYLHSLGAFSGFIRDVEGEITSVVSDADVAFHALRPYQNGDDRRHIHWRMSAHTGELMMRQYQETRRSHHLVILDISEKSYAELDFELAVEVVASLCVSSLSKGQAVTLVVGQTQMECVSIRVVLDYLTTLKRISEDQNFYSQVVRAGAKNPQASICSIVTGPENTMKRVQQLCLSLPSSLRTNGIRCDQGAIWRRSEQGKSELFTLGELAHLGWALGNEGA